MVSLQDIEGLVEAGKYEEAETQLAAVDASSEDQAELAYMRGLILERTTRWLEAEAAYRQALEADDKHIEAMFHLAYLLDLHGNEEEAIELYEQCVDRPPMHVNLSLIHI